VAVNKMLLPTQAHN